MALESFRNFRNPTASPANPGTKAAESVDVGGKDQSLVGLSPAAVPLRAWVIAAESDTRRWLEDELARRGYTAVLKSRVPEQLPGIEELPELLILDHIGQPSESLDYCRRFRELAGFGSSLVLMLCSTKQFSELDQILHAGADEFLLVPMEPLRWAARLTIIEQRIARMRRHQHVLEELHCINERLDLAIHGANDGLWDARPRSDNWMSPDNEVWYSPRMKELMGYQDHEFPNVLGSWLERLHPEDEGDVMQALANHIMRKAPYNVEYRLRTAQGDYRWFSARGQAIWDDQGQFVRMSGSIRDITEQRSIRDELQASEARWRTLVESMPDLAVLLDPDGTIRFINRVLPGYRIDEVIGRSVFDYVLPQHHATVRAALDEVVRTGQPQQYEAQGLAADGSIAWYSSRLGALKHADQVAALIMVSTDVTDRKLSDEALRTSQQRLTLAIQGADLGFWDWSMSTGQVVYSSLWCQMLGYLPSEIEPHYRAWERLLHPDDRNHVLDLLRDHLHGKRPLYEAEFRMRTKPGGWKWILARGTVVERAPDGTPLRMSGTHLDITERKLAESAVAHERRILRRLLELQERERQIVAYEIHDGVVQQMAAALMHLDALDNAEQRRSPTARNELARSVDLVRSAVGEGRRLISGLRPPILDEMGIEAAIEYLVNEVRRYVPDVELMQRTFCGRLVPAVESAIFRIVQEGLTNIRKHSGSRRARVELMQHGKYIRLVVRDWGQGFDPSVVQEERFGLQGIRQRARLLGTVATIESAPGRGTVVVVDFPLLPAEIAEREIEEDAG